VTALSIPTVQHEQVQDLLRRANEEWDDGRLASAAALANKAISAGGGGEAHSLLGSIYMSNGQFEAAERELAEAARLNPRDKEAAKLLADARRARAEHGE
jgi:Flp pilus assembly protein TadD